MQNNISIIGLGKLGLCFALTLEKAGYNILGLDINPEYVKEINQKTLISHEPDVEKLLKNSTNFRATTSIEETIWFSNIIFIIVATPSLPDGRYDHSQIDNLIQQLESLGRQNTQKHFIVCCTTLPGYCDSIRDRLSSLNYSVSYNPEFIAQGTILRDQASPDMVLIGQANDEIGQIIEDIYKKHTINSPKICRMTPIEAEITKLSLNCFLTTKIAFANMIGDLVKASGGNPDLVLSAIGSDSRIGPKYLKYGYGYGGPCFPRDNRALAIYANDKNCASDISIATDTCNKKHLDFMLTSFKDISATIDGVTYKPNSMILEESQQLAYAVGLAKKGIKVTIKDNPIVLEKVKKIYGDLFTYAI